MKINRLFEMVYILINKKKTTTRELAEHFEVSQRTVLRDLEALSQAGIPIYATPGKGGGVSILDRFVLNKTAVSDEEQNQILFALQSLESVGHMESAEVVSRLRALFGKTDTDWIEVDFSRWGDFRADREKFELLKQAIIRKQAVAFSYASSNGETTKRTVCPLKMVFKSKSWYLQAYCLSKDGYRTFKINRILSMEIGEESFAGRDFSPPPVDSQEPCPDGMVHLVLAFSRQAAYRVYDEFDAGSITQHGDGSFTVTTDLPGGWWLYGFLLSFGTAVEVVEPESVRSRLLRELEAMRRVYVTT